MTISVIIPVYNTAKYLKKCIESVLNQTYKDFEIILVNDASTDNSLEICKQYVAKYPNIRLIDKPINEGVEKARYSGINLIKETGGGKFITLIDSDDYIEPETFYNMIKCQTETNADIIQIQSYRSYSFFKRKQSIHSTLYDKFITQPSLFNDYYISFFGINILPVSAWGKLYRTECILNANISAFGTNMGEDLIFNMRLFPHINSYYISDYVGYNYRYGGMTSKYNSRLLPDLKKQYIFKKECIEKYDYHKAFEFAAIEIKNILRSDIYQQIVYIKDKTTILNNISQELLDPIWTDMKLLVEINPKHANDPFIRAIIDHNAETLYNQVSQSVHKDRYKIAIKRILSKLI